MVLTPAWTSFSWVTGKLHCLSESRSPSRQWGLREVSRSKNLAKCSGPVLMAIMQLHLTGAQEGLFPPSSAAALARASVWFSNRVSCTFYTFCT